MIIIVTLVIIFLLILTVLEIETQEMFDSQIEYLKDSSIEIKDTIINKVNDFPALTYIAKSLFGEIPDEEKNKMVKLADNVVNDYNSKIYKDIYEKLINNAEKYDLNPENIKRFWDDTYKKN
jgi:hypothetical protein